jgi:hypothetical protein
MAGPVGVTPPGTDLAGWTPVRVNGNGEPLIEWRWLGDARFRQPFFIQTVDEALQRPFSLLFSQETPIETLAGLAPGPDPSGLVLHVSRCGSTLVTQMLATEPARLVLSEPLPVDGILRAHASVDQRARWLRMVVGALGRAGDTGRGYVLKLDAWAACDLDVVRVAFPDTPWIFLHRDPLEVLASHLRQRGAHMVPGALAPELFGLDRAMLAAMTPEEYMARVFAAICRGALTHRDEKALFLDYRALPGAVDDVLDWFGLDANDDERERMNTVAHLNAKNPRLPFTRDPTAASDLSPALHAAVDRWARPVYEEVVAC